MLSSRYRRESDPTLKSYIDFWNVPIHVVIDRFLMDPTQFFETFILRIKYISRLDADKVWDWIGDQEDSRVSLCIEKHMAIAFFYYYQEAYTSAKAEVLLALESKGNSYPLLSFIAMYFTNMDQVKENMREFLSPSFDVSVSDYMDSMFSHPLYALKQVQNGKADKNDVSAFVNYVHSSISKADSWMRVCFGLYLLETKDGHVKKVFDDNLTFNPNHYGAVMLQDAANEESIHASYFLAKHLQEKYKNKNAIIADLYRKAAILGHPQGLLNLAEYYIKAVPEYKKQAIEYFHELVINHYPEALFVLAEMYHGSRRVSYVEKDPAKAAHYYYLVKCATHDSALNEKVRRRLISLYAKNENIPAVKYYHATLTYYEGTSTMPFRLYPALYDEFMLQDNWHYLGHRMGEHQSSVLQSLQKKVFQQRCLIARETNLPDDLVGLISHYVADKSYVRKKPYYEVASQTEFPKKLVDLILQYSSVNDQDEKVAKVELADYENFYRVSRQPISQLYQALERGISNALQIADLYYHYKYYYKAFQFYKRAAEEEMSFPAYFKIAQMLHLGQGTTRDDEGAAFYLQKIVKLAMYKLSELPEDESDIEMYVRYGKQAGTQLFGLYCADRKNPYITFYLAALAAKPPSTFKDSIKSMAITCPKLFKQLRQKESSDVQKKIDNWIESSTQPVISFWNRPKLGDNPHLSLTHTLNNGMVKK